MKASASNGRIDQNAVMLVYIVILKRDCADIIARYIAKEVAKINIR